MARRSDNTRIELKEKAIEAGIALLAEGGVEALTARAIAQRIGYTVGTLYNIFEDLEDITLHLNASTIAQMHAALLPLAQGSQAPEKRLLALARGYGDYALTHPARWHLLHAAHYSRPLPDWYRAEIQRPFVMVETLLAELGIAATEIPIAARTLWAGLHGICALHAHQKLSHTNAEPMHTLMEHFAIHYVRGLKRSA
jgi:AcrR family transcriptional regulator